jgi:serine/threonine-protein kinase
VAVALSALTDALQDRFPVERELGRGGMGVVFLARDLRHQRQVVIKVIRPELASVVGAERFGREIQLAAQLQHPNIVPVYESGECAGTLYYVMPYVAGESLRERLRREGQLPLDEAVRIARDVADALSYAHAQGVVHRDIKPENILLAGGHALVVDFGIARALGAAGSERLTETGLVVGTPAYMSPEQSSGSGALDGRSDLYSLACVVYEMLAGEPPYTGPSAQAILAKRLTEPVPHLRTVRAEIPDAVERAVTKALAKAPADRFPSASEFAHALQAGSVPTLVASRGAGRAGRRFPISAATLGLGFAIGLGVLFAWHRSREVAEPAVRRLAVLPFDNLGDSADGYFADGVTEAVRAKLTTMPQFQVIASYSSNQYRHTTKAPRQIGQELGVDYLLVGTVRWSKGPGRESRIQVSPELVEVGSAAAKWGQPFDAALTDVFQVQADIASQVAQALGVALSATAHAVLASRPTQNLSAYDSLLRGDQLLITEGRLEREAFMKAAGAYRAAVRLDSTFGLAWGRLGWAEAGIYNDSEDEDDSAAMLAKQAADRALVLAPNLAQTYYTMGMVRRFVYGDDESGVPLFERARELAPQDVNVLTQLGIQLGEVRGRWDEAVTLFARAARLDPRSPLVARRYAWGLVEAGRWKAADSVGSAGLKFAPDNGVLLAAVVEARLNQGDVAGARAALHDAVPYLGRRLVDAFPMKVWLMDDSLRELAQHLPPEFFHEVRGVALMRVAELNWNEGRYAAARADAASALPLLRQYLDRRPTNTERMQWVMTAYAYLGRCAEARQVRKRIGEDTSSVFLAGDWLAIAVRCGDYATAVAVADTLIRRGKVSRMRLRVDPAYALLRGRPDFERLVAGE